MIKVFFAIFFLYNFSFADCPKSYSYGNFEGPLSFSTYGSYGFLGDLNVLKIYNLSNPVSPSYISSIDLKDKIYNIYVLENYVYCGVQNKGLIVVAVTNVSKPKIVSSISFDCTCSCPMTSFGNYVYLCSDGLYILDISNKASPKILKHYSDIPCGKPFIDGNYLYLSSGYILSISDPKNPVILANSNECAGSDIFVQGNYSYFPGWYKMLIICDITDKKNPKKISELGWGGYGGKIFNLIEFKDDIVYVTGNVSIHMIDAYDKSNPFEFGLAVSSGNNDIHINGNYLYACAYDKVLRIFDISECKHEYLYPQASFEYEPLNPRAGEKVYFKDTSYPYATSFLWEFGDGQKSTLKNPENVFLKEGEYEIKFTAKNPAGETTISKRIYVSKGQDAPPFDSSGEYKYLIPAVAHKQGANGTFWQSDIEITNDPYGDDTNVNIYFIEQGEGSCNFQGFNVLLKSGGQIRLRDIVYKMFQEEKAGALWITSDIPVFISSRTYNTGGGEGTYGQYVPAIEKEKLYKNNKEVVLPNVVWNEEFRTNIGFVNIENREIHFCFNYETGEGPLCMTMPPCSWNQYSLSDLIDVNYGYGYFEGFLWTMGYTDGLFLYSSVIDNKTGDAIFIPEIVKP